VERLGVVVQDCCIKDHTATREQKKKIKSGSRRRRRRKKNNNNNNNNNNKNKSIRKERRNIQKKTEKATETIFAGENALDDLEGRNTHDRVLVVFE